jgi:hypothetical protein
MIRTPLKSRRVTTLLSMGLLAACALPEADAREPENPGDPRVDVVHAFPLWPMPDALPGSRTMPSYTSTANTVIDNVTGLIWQRNLPATYAGCTGKSPQYSANAANAALGSGCSWEEAMHYCAFSKDVALIANIKPSNSMTTL